MSYTYKIGKGTKYTHTLKRLPAILLVVASVMGIVLPLQAVALGTTVTPVATQGWQFIDDNGNGGNGNFVSGPTGAGSVGNGSAQLSISASNQGYMLYKPGFDGTKLADMTNLSYKTYVQTGNNTIAPSLQLNIDKDVTDADATWQGRLVYEPYMNGTVTDGVWQTWNAQSGKWWLSGSVSHFTGNCGQAAPCTFAELEALYPNIGINTGILAGVGFKAGSGWNVPFVGNVDDFTINTTTYDFEPILAPVVTATNFNTNGGTDYKGVNVGFTLNHDFRNVLAVKVELFHGSTLLATNTQNQKLLDLINGGETSLSTPFITIPGTYVEEYWNLGAWQSDATPDKAVITVTDGDGTPYTATNTNLAEPNNVLYANIRPVIVPASTGGSGSGPTTTVVTTAAHNQSTPLFHPPATVSSDDNAVLDATTNQPAADPGQQKATKVLGAESTKNTQAKPNKDSSNFLGLGWWWLLVFIVIAAPLYLFLSLRNEN